MWPVIFDFGTFTILGREMHIAIYSYGFMLVVAFYSCYFLLQKDLRRINLDQNLASDIIFSAAVGGIVGSKIYYLIENFGRVIDDPIGMIFSGSGLVFLGGLMGGMIGVTWVIKKNNLNWIQMGDTVAPLLILGYGIGRLGCFFVGDDYGIPTHMPWGIAFENGLPPTTYSSFQYNYPWISLDGFEQGLLSVYPTQLMEAGIALLIFGYLWNRRTHIKFDGELFFIYLILAGLERFFIEFIRTNEKYAYGILTGSQIISIVMIFIGIYFLWINQRPIVHKSGTNSS